MVTKKIRIGRHARYEVKGCKGTGRVLKHTSGKTGDWVQLFDPKRDRILKVRPSQVQEV